MKRATLILLAVFAILTASSQSIYYAEKAGSITWNSRISKWDYADAKPVFMKITIHGSTVLVDDDVKSNYKLYNISSESDGRYSYTIWNATDEAGRECNFKVSYTDGDAYMHISVFYISKGWGVYYLVNTTKK